MRFAATSPTRTGTADTLFADPPFDLNKQYGKNGGDDLPVAKYLAWSKRWIAESVRVVAPGGALFLYNLPKWLIEYGAYLNSFPEMTFKHWIAVDKAHSLPIPNRLSPSPYGLLYYIKGKKPRVFNRDLFRTPIQTCRHCGTDVKDYGGHKKFLNPKGLNLTDVWDDVPPVRHRKLISWEQGSHPEWETNKKRIAGPSSSSDRTDRVLPLLDAITN